MSMTRTTDSDARLLAAATADAVSAARWERIDLEARRPLMAHRDLLLAKAAELAMSPIGRDQLMSLALEYSVRDVDPDAPLLDIPARPAERAMIARRVFVRGPHRTSETESLVVQIEERHARRLVREARFDLLPGCLLQDATLQELLWDHPDIPATDDARLAMLCSIPKLLERIEDLQGGWSWGTLPRWFSAVARGAAR